MRIAITGVGMMLLAACGSAANNVQAQANGAGLTPSTAPAPAPAPGGGIVSPDGANQAAPRPQPAAADSPIPGPVELSGPLVGRWGRMNSCAQTMEFFADGRVSIPDGAAGTPQWRVPVPGQLDLIENGRAQAGRFEIRDSGRTLRLLHPSGRAIDFIRC